MAESNIYGVDVAMGPTGDLVVNAAGDLAAVGNVAVVAQALQLRLRTALGDLTLHPSYGTNLPIGSKMDPSAVAATLNSELAVTITDDPRIRSATVTNVEWPVSGNSTAMALSVTVVLAGGETFEVAGLPAEVRIGEVTLEGNVIGESGFSPFEEAPYFADEPATEQIEGESELDSLINDLPTGA
jgi:phage baseplate assembly protein W